MNFFTTNTRKRKQYKNKRQINTTTKNQTTPVVVRNRSVNIAETVACMVSNRS